MTDDGRPAEIEALARIAWAPPPDATQMHQLVDHFSTLSAEHDADPHAQAALRTLIAVCFMYAVDDEWERPYRPAMSFAEGRTAMPSDLSTTQLDLLEYAVSATTNEAFVGRVADILWLRRTPGAERFRFARLAVEAWARLSYTPDTWFPDFHFYFNRASQLAARLNMQDLLEELRFRLRDGILENNSTGATVRMGDLYRRRFANSVEVDLFACKLEIVASSPDASPSLKRASLQAASKWRLQFGQDAEGYELLSQVAHLWVAESEDRLATEGGSHMVAASLLESALQQVRVIPRRFRDVTLRTMLGELPGRIREHGRQALDEMSRFDSEPVDLQSAVDAMTEAVRGRDAVEALATLFALIPFASFEQDRVSAEELGEGSISAMLTHTVLDAEGRRVSQSVPGQQSRYGVDQSIWHRMLQSYNLRVQLIAQSAILPALREITNEHRLQFADFDVIVSGSSLVPPNRSELLARGLWDGYSGNFASALHILTPQLEALVRDSMNQGGLPTSGIDADGVEQEWGLSTLMASDRVGDLLGGDLAYEIRALFCDPLGPNLRNTVAHGLINSAEAFGIRAVYVWWLVFRVIFIPYFNRLRGKNPGGADTNASAV